MRPEAIAVERHNRCGAVTEEESRQRKQLKETAAVTWHRETARTNNRKESLSTACGTKMDDRKVSIR